MNTTSTDFLWTIARALAEHTYSYELESVTLTKQEGKTTLAVVANSGPTFTITADKITKEN